MSRTASGRWRAVNIMRSGPTKGDQVMSDRTGSVIVTGAARPAHSVARAASPVRLGGWPDTGATRLRPACPSSRPPLRPDEEQQHAERDAVDVVLRVPALDPPEQITAAQRPRAQEVQEAVHEVAVDPPDQAREAQDEATVEPSVEGVETVAVACEDVDHREWEGRGQPTWVERAALVRGPGGP